MHNCLKLQSLVRLLLKGHLPRIVVEHLLRGLSMMYVPVYNEDSLRRGRVQQVLGGYRHVVEKTIAAIFGFHSMVSRWSGKRHRNKNKTCESRILPDDFLNSSSHRFISVYICIYLLFFFLQLIIFLHVV